jgi:hypothetical protein
MENSVLILVLALATLGIVLFLGLHQLGRIRHSQAKRGERPGGVAGPSEE